MNQRDTFKSSDYFQKSIAEKRHNIAEYQSLVGTSTLGKEHQTSLFYATFRAQLELWIARYSAGESIPVLRSEFPDVVESLAGYLQQECSEPIDFYGLTDYIQSLWLVSIAILLDASDDLLNRLLLLINQTGVDALFDRLIYSRLPQYSTANSLIHPAPYSPLYQALDVEGEVRNGLIILFIRDYYENVEGVYWAGSHRERDIFFGYWLFELAAFAKCYSIDDRSFSSSIYYPGDLVQALII